MFVFLLAPCAYTKVPVSGALVGSLPLVSTHKELMANTGLHLISLVMIVSFQSEPKGKRC